MKEMSKKMAKIYVQENCKMFLKSWASIKTDHVLGYENSTVLWVF